MRNWRMLPNQGPRRPVMTLAEPDYRPGSGPLRLAVLHVRRNRPHREGAEVWYEVEGIEIGDDGRERGSRAVLVRGSRLHALPDNTGHHH
ncbi:hypothetical protein Acy02nite_32980 [Actinoplanes cyaneus]|uniref:Uncharacterized protein n=1 Tax=Actinoplanes cyaneus TaxID=52696 RepID=A0A919IJB7_9ACTN|nr:hypothetical protein [Actinoplanes cyaneus]MCW2140103.1 hypothetical protein [Actinoplanes cyaneus]GID65417.1 hypothetical protein Acy02nite_32980 [Actinoplanes cyaneus]